jgi:hypothetical protein
LFDIRENGNMGRSTITLRSSINTSVLVIYGGKRLTGIVIRLQSEGDLFLFVGTRRTPCGFTSGLNGRQKKGDQNADDRNDNEKFDKGKSAR